MYFDFCICTRYIQLLLNMLDMVLHRIYLWAKKAFNFLNTKKAFNFLNTLCMNSYASYLNA